jgi:hypothetical protein
MHLYLIGTWLTSAIIALTAQGTSSFFSPNASDGSVRSGLALLKASLIMQLFLNVAFIAVIATFYHRCSSQGIFRRSEEQSTKIISIALCISTTWILVRNVFRTAQIFLPSDSPAWTAEAYFWVFDATPMMAYTVLLHILHPAKYFQRQGDCRAARGAAVPVVDVDIEREPAGQQ